MVAEWGKWPTRRAVRSRYKEKGLDTPLKYILELRFWQYTNVLAAVSDKALGNKDERR